MKNTDMCEKLLRKHAKNIKHAIYKGREREYQHKKVRSKRVVLLKYHKHTCGMKC